ncbi:MAG: hypothetical protein JNK65_09500 [Deltaproteobacteria bacterium]|nr:hypothetical protein [Deltaproteobacteria bacterium]
MATFEFNEEQHVYKINGIPVPSVTQVLGEVGIIDDRFYTEEGKIRGKAIHMATQLFDEGDLDSESVHPSIGGYLKGYIRFIAETGFMSDLIEKLVYSETWMVAGTLDRRGRFPNRPSEKVIIDIKSGGVEPWAALQMAGYELMLGERHTRQALQLFEDGRYKLHKPYRNPNDKNIFLSALAITHWKRNQKGVIYGSSNEVAA